MTPALGWQCRIKSFCRGSGQWEDLRLHIEYLQFYVDEAMVWRQWFVQRFGYQSLGSLTDADHHSELLCWGRVRVLLTAPLNSLSAAAAYLKRHPPGIVDVAFRVEGLAAWLERFRRLGGRLCRPLQTWQRQGACLRWCQIRGWGSLCHTLIERHGTTPPVPNWPQIDVPSPSSMIIDHAVLNVPAGELPQAARWYETMLGFQSQQRFVITTPRSGLASVVLSHPQGSAQFPINEPTSANSQIQEFLNHNRGAGIQHVAIETPDIVRTVAQLRRQGVKFLEVPSTYYEQLQQRPGFRPEQADWDAIAQQQILVDWLPDIPEALLLQTFTEPIFREPTCFFELIERCPYRQNQRLCKTQGFGEGNFQALFEAIERQQAQRGSLQ
ncbi:4-hydroxyphenylpyruvate dioxygenase [Halomicronema hongdechloris C2206]|uniref:4-hydroxyphenylpyruvate dioxygenase n=1 Tax=Halomicronema hongdechloris C2206 TaxID=1641165 RepID=A0A1Z3HP36_9CYAN|nr:4-hydroxyphenylpyruvate dioxygenase [Halomicronema hongdechloris]ASC72036.1 4-hydroxyphenylpyruvate dioxygenase [Halomicronema hongdechloris C2206]